MLHLTTESHPKWKRAAAGFLAIAMCACSLPLQALAADFTVSNSQQMYDSWNTANASGSTSNNFYMNNSINMSGYSLTVQEGNSYWIGSVSGENNTISDVTFEQGDKKGGTVTVNANVGGTDTVLEVSGSNVDVTVNKNVTQTNAKTTEYNAVNVSGADVTIKGSVKSESDAIGADSGSKVVVNGSVTSADGMGVHASSDSSVTVKGNLTAEDLAIDAFDAKVTVNGNVISEEDRGILAREDAAVVTVGGNVTSEEAGVTAYDDAKVTVKGSVTSEEEGVVAREGAAVTVNKNVSAGTTGIEVRENGKVTVKGNLTADGMGLSVSDGTVTVNGSVTANGQTALTNGAEVTIDGNFTSDKTSNDVGEETGVFVMDSELTVNGNLRTPLLNASDDSEVFIAGKLNAKVVTVGNGDQLDPNDKEDTTTLRTGDIYWTKGTDNAALYANGHSNTTVYGSVMGKVHAKDTATVNVTGTVAYGKVEGDGFVQSYLKDIWTCDPKIWYHPGDNSTLTEVEALCRGYFPGSLVYEQMSSMLTEMNKAMNIAEDEMFSFSGFISGVLNTPEVLISKYFSSSSFFEKIAKSAKKESRDALEATDKVNAYEIEMYEAVLEAALKETGDEFGLVIAEEEIQNIAEVAAEICEKKDKKDWDISIDEAMKYLVEMGGYKKNEPALLDSARQLLDLLEFADEVKLSNKVVAWLLKTPEFAEYWTTNYANQVAVLDNMLTNMEMTPNQLLATANLRAQYTHKFLGTLIKACEEVTEELPSLLLSEASIPVKLTAILSGAALEASGSIKKADALENCAAMGNMLPQMYNACEAAIIRVRDGDTSPEAVQLVMTSYTLFRETLEYMARNVACLDKDLKDEYLDLASDLDDMDIGEEL